MKKLVLLFSMLFIFSSSLISCRDTTNNEEVQNEEVQIEEEGDIENTLEEGVNEVQENTGTGGTDDI